MMLKIKIKSLIGLLVISSLALAAVSAEITPVPDKVACAIADSQAFTQPDQASLTGWLGSRIAASLTNRLETLDTERLLEGYYQRPGRQAWDGEHVGKWLNAATLAWVYSGDPALRAKLDKTAAELCRCQLDDGYLGTYLPKDYWTSWDVWSHKYNLIGLLTYMRYTGNLAPLPTCERMGDLLCKTFGDAPGQRDIITAGEHMGMAPTSVLEPMVLLYRFTGERRYLDFCQYLLRAWEQPNGPHIISRLLELKRVDRVGNAKAYEMLSCLNGALELYRTTGDPKLLASCQNAWADIVSERLYITGGTSAGEHFQADEVLPNDPAAHICETCVTVTWMQLNLQLLRLTGESKYADQLEKSVYNHLLAAQKPDGDDWCYYTPLEGRKPYDQVITCCHSSGPRGIALLPSFAIAADQDGAVVNLYDPGVVRLKLADGTPVTLRLETSYPANGKIHITIETTEPKEFSLKLRVPEWCAKHTLRPSGARVGADGYATLRRTWKSGDTIDLNLEMTPRLVLGQTANPGRASIQFGPLVLAADESLLPAATQSALADFALPGAKLTALNLRPEPATGIWKTWPGAQLFRVNAITRHEGKPFTARLVPFADAGMDGSSFKIWLPIGKAPSGKSLELQESRSRPGNVEGSIIDGNPNTFVVTWDSQPATQDWFAVAFPAPVAINRVVFTHGRTFHDGGWFDASAGQPQVQVQTAAGGPWETVGVLSDYPPTTATTAAGLVQGEHFTCKLSKAIKAFGVRVIGKPASGDNLSQAFASCGELRAE